MKKLLSLVRASEKKEIKALPYFIYFWTTGAAAILGLGSSIYLTVSHYRNYTDMTYKSFCAITKSINCDTISQSKYSIFLDIPVPIWGIIGYSVFFMLWLCARKREGDARHIWSLLFVVSGAFSGYSIVLAIISIYKINAYCMMCVFTYLINFFLFFYTWLTRRRFEKCGPVSGTINGLRYLFYIRSYVIPGLIVIIAAIVFLMAGLPEYWKMPIPKPSKTISTGVTIDGHPWIGAQSPEITIEAFSDYRCFQCAKLHFFIRQLIAERPDRIRLIHRHFPMDHKFNPIVNQPFHSGSAKLSLIAIYAVKMNKFWEMNDLLFEKHADTIFDIKDIAHSIGLDAEKLARAIYDPELRRRLRVDIKEGISYGLTGTPSFIINGRIFKGEIPQDIVGEMIK